MTTKTEVAPDGLREAVFQRTPPERRFVDNQHSVFSKFIDRPPGATDVDQAEEIRPFLDQLDRGLGTLAGTVRTVEESTEELQPVFRALKLAEVIPGPIEALQKAAAEKVAEAAASVSHAEKRLAVSVQRPAVTDSFEALRLDLQLREIRAELRELSAGARVGVVARAIQERGDWRFSWAVHEAPTPLIPAEQLLEIERRLAAQRSPWRSALIEFRRDVHRTTLELIGGAFGFITATLARAEDAHGLKVRLAPFASFVGQDPLPTAGVVEVIAPQKKRRRRTAA